MIDPKEIAAQLRKPEGELGKQVGLKMNESNAHMNRFAFEQLQLHDGDRLLEIGMGNGFFVKDLFEINPTITYTGIDYAELMIEEAEEVNRHLVESGQVKFILASSHAIPADDQTFNTAFTVNTIYFWDHPVKNLAEIKRVLKTGGSLHLAIRPARLMKDIPFTAFGFTLYEKEEVIRLFEKAGFSHVSATVKQEPVQEINGLDMQLETVIVSGKREM